ncbi:MAG: SRPBCC domain-containing protein [Gemella sp.]|nr:SRPBCC domain-containing protein [Gemella sp.]
MSSLNISLNKKQGNYILKVDYVVTTDNKQTWEILATDAGFTKWFPQLHIEETDSKLTLVFEMDDFREEMKILEYQENKKIAYSWGEDKVTFVLEEVNNGIKVNFEEIIPESYSTEYSDAKKDMTGWLVQNHYLNELMGNGNFVEKEELKEFYEGKINEFIGGVE